MDHNPKIFTTSELIDMSVKDIMIANYKIDVAFYSLVIAILIFYAGFRVAVWLLPNFYYKETTQ